MNRRSLHHPIVLEQPKVKLKPSRGLQIIIENRNLKNNVTIDVSHTEMSLYKTIHFRIYDIRLKRDTKKNEDIFYDVIG